MILRTGGQIDDACFAYGRVSGRQSVTVRIDGQRYDVPVSHLGAWAFIKIRTRRSPPGTDRPRRLYKNVGTPPGLQAAMTKIAQYPLGRALTEVGSHRRNIAWRCAADG